MNHLERLVAGARRELERRRPLRSEEALRRAAERRQPRDFAAALRAAPGVALIAEHKRRSPSAGTIRDDLALEAVVGAYERGGAAAVSVLTDAPSFGGSLEDLAAARAATRLPILRKDFIVDRHQVLEAAAAGADALLLIVAALVDAELRELHAQAAGLGLAALVEVHDERELERALAAGAGVVGVNNRDLRTLEVDTDRTFELRERIPAECVMVAESGFSRPEELRRLEAAGVDAVLIGEALMRASDIELACRELCRGA
jgi:indole-3-glycerol phosphate synthase